MKPTISVFLFAMPLVACAPNIGKDVQDDTDDTATTGGDVVNVNNGDSTTTTINATDSLAWIYYDFESGSGVEVEDAATELNWDLAFQRYTPKMNGGVSGSGGMGVALLDGEDFDALSEAPYSGYLSDAESAEETGTTEYVMAEWYDYDYTTHLLSPADRVYVVRTVEGNYFKLRFDNYYDEAGTSGYLQFTWAAIDEPSGSDTGDVDTGEGPDPGPEPEDDSAVNCTSTPDLVLTTADSTGYRSVVNSAASDSWTCLSLLDAEQVDSAWDFAWKTWGAALPMGFSGIILPGQDYAALTTAPSEGWSNQNMSLFDGWYDYDSSTHILTPKDRVYVLKDDLGNYWKLQIESYYGDDNTLHRPTFRWAEINAPE